MNYHPLHYPGTGDPRQPEQHLNCRSSTKVENPLAVQPPPNQQTRKGKWTAAMCLDVFERITRREPLGLRPKAQSTVQRYCIRQPGKTLRISCKQKTRFSEGA